MTNLQRRFLAAKEAGQDVSAKMLLLFMETVGIECAVWPHLYWKTSICKIYIRSQDMRRLQRADKPDEDESSDEDDENPVCAECRQSAKTSQGFMVWVLAVLVVLVLFFFIGGR